MSRPSSTKLLKGSPGEWSSPQPKCPSLAPRQGNGPIAAEGRTLVRPVIADVSANVHVAHGAAPAGHVGDRARAVPRRLRPAVQPGTSQSPFRAGLVTSGPRAEHGQRGEGYQGIAAPQP